MNKKLEQLVKIETLQGVIDLKSGDEVIFIRTELAPERTLTVHGKYVRNTSGELGWLDVADSLTLPVAIKITNKYEPDKILSFLRDFQDPRFPREPQLRSYNLMGFGSLSDDFELYKVE